MNIYYGRETKSRMDCLTIIVIIIQFHGHFTGPSARACRRPIDMRIVFAAGCPPARHSPTGRDPRPPPPPPPPSPGRRSRGARIRHGRTPLISQINDLWGACWRILRWYCRTHARARARPARRNSAGRFSARPRRRGEKDDRPRRYFYRLPPVPTYQPVSVPRSYGRG